MRKLSPEWIVVGSSPSAPVAWELARERAVAEYPSIIVANRSHQLMNDDTPDLFFIGGEIVGDPQTLAERYGPCYPPAKRMQTKGTHVLTLAREPATIKAAGLAFVDEKIKVDIGYWGRWRFKRGHYTACGYSGLFCVQYAINHGAEIIHCVGMEGYDKAGHYFDGGPDVEVNHTGDVLEPFTQAVIDACPEVQFSFYGKLVYDVHGPNVQVIPCNSNSIGVGASSAPETSPTSPTEPLTS